MVPVSGAYLAGPLNNGPAFNAIGFSACVALARSNGTVPPRPAA